MSNLTAYGILEEKSEYRAHVSIVTGRVYFFQTQAARDAILTGKYKTALAYTGGVKSAKGFLVPPRDIVGLQAVKIPPDVFERAAFSESMSESRKGEAACNVVISMLERWAIRIPLIIRGITGFGEQLSGLDISVNVNAKIQVKCDWKSGPKNWGGTGNLFIQTHERNVNSQY